MTARAGIILAAGQGTRMKSAKPKVMHEVAGRPMLGHVIAALRGAGVERVVVVTAPDAQEVRDYAAREGAETVIQAEQKGTGHAASCAAALLEDFAGVVVTTYGDMPLLTPAIFEASFAAREQAGMALAAFRAHDPAQYGRVVLDADGRLERIVEFKDAGAAERAIDLCNAGIMAAEAGELFAGRGSSKTTMRRANIISPTFRPSPKPKASLARSAKSTKAKCWASTAAPSWRPQKRRCSGACVRQHSPPASA